VAVAKWHCVEISCIKNHRNRARSTVITGGNWFPPIYKVWLSLSLSERYSPLHDSSIWINLIPNFMEIWQIVERDHLDDLGVDESKILKRLFSKLSGWRGLDWSNQDTVTWRAVVSVVMNIRIT